MSVVGDGSPEPQSVRARIGQIAVFVAFIVICFSAGFIGLVLLLDRDEPATTSTATESSNQSEMTEEVAFRFAIRALGLGRVTGCGELKVIDYDDRSVVVKCYDGRTHEIVSMYGRWYVNGREVAR